MSEAADTVSDIASRGNPNSCPKVVDSSETIQSITKKVPGMIYQFQLFPDGRSFFPYASEGIHSIFEVTPEQVRETADPALLLVHSDDILEMFSSIRHSSATLEPWHYIFRVNLPVRGVRWVEGEATPERLPDGSTLWHGYMRDVTARKQLDLESIGKDRNFRTLIESSSDIIALLTPEGGLKYLNPAFEKVLGLRPEEWQNRTFHELIWPEDLGLAVDVFTQSLMSPRKVVHWQLRLHHANGGFRWLEGTGINHLEDPVIGAVLVNCRDITERKKGEIALQESEERYRRAERGTNDVLWDWNMITDVVYRSPQWFKILGYEPGELKCDHLTTLDLVHPEDKAAVEKNLLDHFELGVPFCQELRLRTKSGDFRWVQSRGEVERDAQGKPVRMSGVYSDISARKRAEAEVINERNRLRQILDSQPTFFSLLTLDGIIQEVNQTPLKIIQRSLEDVVGLRFVEMACLDSESNAKAENAIQIAATGGTVHEDLVADLPGKGRRNMDATFYPLKDAEGQVTGLVAFGMDVTDRKKAEARVSQLNRIYAILSEINNDIIHEKDTAAMLTAACRIAVETGKLRMAWVGMFDAQSLTVKPVAIAGIDDGYVSQVNINLMDESRKGPAARCIQSGEYAISKDIQNDPCFVPWRDEALRRGYRSSGVFPLKVEGRVVGCFALYADTIDFFNKEELVLLSELAMNMGFALEVAQKEQERQRIQSQLKESEARYKVLFDSAPDAVFLVAAE